MRYNLVASEVNPEFFRWEAPDGTELVVTKQTIADHVQSGGTDYAVSQIFSALNLAFSNNLISGNAYITVETDGTPLDFYQESSEE